MYWVHKILLYFILEQNQVFILLVIITRIYKNMNNWNEIVRLKERLTLVILHMKILILKRGKNKNVSIEIIVTVMFLRKDYEKERGRQKVPAWCVNPQISFIGSHIQLFLLIYQQAPLSSSMSWGWRFIFDRPSSTLQQIFSWIDTG